MVHINLIGWLAVTSTVFSSVVVDGAEEVPQITRDINKNDAARRLYNGGVPESGGSNTALQESEIPDQCFLEVLWTEEQCRNWVLGNTNIQLGNDFARPNLAVKGCFLQNNLNRAFWGEYSLSNNDYLERVGSDVDNGRQTRIFCSFSDTPIPTRNPTASPSDAPTTPEPTDEPTVTPAPFTPSPTDNPLSPTDEPTLWPTVGSSEPPTLWPTVGDDCDDKWGGGKGWGCKHDDDDDDWSGSSSGSSGWKNSGRSHSSGGKWKHSRSGHSKAHKRRSEWRRSGRRSSSWSSVSNDGGKSNWKRPSSSNSGWRRPKWGSLRQAEFDIATCHGSKSEEKTSKECKDVTVDGACIERCTLTINHKCNGETMNLETITTDDRKSDTPC